MRAFLRKHRVWIVTLLAMLPTIIPIICGERGFAAPESCCFLMHYNSGQSLVKLIFDPAKTDWGFYQGRELSYLVDALDARFIGWCIRQQISHFFSLSFILFLAGTIFCQQFFTAKLFPKLKWYLAALPSLLYGVAYVTGNPSFFRCSKPAVAFLTTLLFFAAVAVIKRRTPLTRRCWEGWTVSGTLLLPFFDRQGFFVAGVFCCGSIAFWTAGALPPVAERFALGDAFRSKARFFSCCGFAALLISSLWNLWICPEIINAVNGYYPNFEYQQLPPGALFNFDGGLPFVFENIGFLAVSTSFLYVNVLGFFIAGFLMLFTIKSVRSGRGPLLLPLTFAMSLAAMVLIGNMMTARHTMILNEDVLFGGYFIVSLAVLCCFMIVIMALSGKVVCRLMVLLLISAIISGTALRCHIISEPGADTDHLYIYKLYRHRLIEFLDAPKCPKKMPMPFSNSVLIDFFRGGRGL